MHQHWAILTQLWTTRPLLVRWVIDQGSEQNFQPATCNYKNVIIHAKTFLMTSVQTTECAASKQIKNRYKSWAVRNRMVEWLNRFLWTDEVKQMNSWPNSSFSLTLCSWVPIKHTALMVGHHRSNSDIQLVNVDFGTITRCGPGISRKCFM